MVGRPSALFWVCLGVFVALTLGVFTGLTAGLDRQALTWLSTLATPSLTQAAITVSLLGSGWVVTPLALGAYLALRHSAPTEAKWFSLAVVGGLLLFLALVFLIDRPRPTFFPSPVSEPTASFPSGHAMNTTVVFLALYLSTGRLRPSWQLWLGWIGVIVVGAVSVSRLYLQIHYPTDLVAGVALGVGWVMALDSFWGHSRHRTQNRTHPP